MPHYTVDDNGDLTEIPDIFDTVAEAQAAKAVVETIYVRSTHTEYTYVPSGSNLVVNGYDVLSTGDGGDTRWVGMNGKYVNQTHFPDLAAIAYSTMLGEDTLRINSANYAFDASAKTITFSDLPFDLSLENIVMIVNTTDQRIIYNMIDESCGGALASNVLTLEHDTTSMDDADKLAVFVNVPYGMDDMDNMYNTCTWFHSSARIPQRGAMINMDAAPKVPSETHIGASDLLATLDSQGSIDGFLQVFRASTQNVHDVLVALQAESPNVTETVIFNCEYANNTEAQQDWVSSDSPDLEVRSSTTAHDGTYAVEFRPKATSSIGEEGRHTYSTVQDWSSYLSICFWARNEHTTPANEAYRLIIIDDDGNAMYYSQDITASQSATWEEWTIPFNTFTNYTLVNLNKVKYIVWELRDTDGNQDVQLIDQIRLKGDSVVQLTCEVELRSFGTNSNPTGLGTLLQDDDGNDSVSFIVGGQVAPHSIHLHRGSHDVSESQKLTVGNYYGLYFKKPAEGTLKIYGKIVSGNRPYQSGRAYTNTSGTNTEITDASMSFSILTLRSGDVKEIQFKVDSASVGSWVYIHVVDTDGRVTRSIGQGRFVDETVLAFKFGANYPERLYMSNEHGLIVHFVDSLDSTAEVVGVSVKLHHAPISIYG